MLILCICYATKPALTPSITIDSSNDVDWLEALTLRHLDPKLGMAMKLTNNSSRKLVLLQLILSGVNLVNPGPSLQYPCGNCGEEVLDEHSGVACDICNKWYHCRCMGISDSLYSRLCSQSNLSWICDCGGNNITKSDSLLTSLFRIEVSNTFSQLDSITTDHDDTVSFPPDFQPKFTSSPNKPPHFRKRTKVRKLLGMQINCNGLKGDDCKTRFVAAVEQHKPDVIFGCESKLDEGTPTYSIFSDEYEVYRKDRTAHGGGVFVAVKNNIVAVDRPEFDSDAEIVWVSIEFAQNGSMYLGSYYRPPDSRNIALDQVQDSMNHILSRQKNLPNMVLAGDCNFPDINWESKTTTNTKTQSKHNLFLNFLNENGLTQLTKEITRPKSGTILDLVMTSNENLIENVNVCPGVSDHNIVLFDINMTPKLQPKQARKIFKYHKADEQEIRSFIKEQSDTFFQNSPETNSIDDNWTFFKSTISQAMDKIPHKMSSGKPSHPYITKDIIRLMNKRDRLYKKARRTKNQRTWCNYKATRNEVQRMIARSHNKYMNEIIGESLKSDGKKFWGFIKSQKRESLGVPTLRVNGKLHVTDEDKAAALNQQYCSVFSQSDNSVVPDLGPSPYPDIGDLEIGQSGVTKQLKAVKTAKASGPDEVPARMLHDYAEELSAMLTFIFHQSYSTGQLPSDWRTARVVGLYKNKGKKTDPVNYRPVSLTCIACKIMEHIVLSHMAKFIAKHKILIDNQHGFRERLSTETQLIEAINDWAFTINQAQQSDVLFLDFSKAFDKVSHHKLLHKLDHYGIRGKTNAWIQGFLLERSQFVSVNGKHSETSPVLSGVPQGSVLGPALFLLYINDISAEVNSTMRLFADDSVLYRAVRTPRDQEILQNDLEKVFHWAQRWDMKFNVSKCAHVCITLKKKPLVHVFEVNGEAVPRESHTKYLGVTISSDLSWNTHSEQIRAKASKTLGLIRRTLGKCSNEVKDTAYKTLVRPQLEYATSAWNPYTERNSKVLESVQRQAARFVCHDYRRESSVTAMLTDLGWDTLKTRRLVHQTDMFYRIHRGIVNISMPQNIIHAPLNATQSAENRRLHNHHHTYQQPHTRVDVYGYSLFPRAIQIWNRLPTAAVTADTSSAFQRAAVPIIREMEPSWTRRAL